MQPSDFFSAINSMRNLTQEALLTDVSLGTASANIGPRLLRHGLSVTAFASLEKHLQFLFEDFTASISGMSINYGALPVGFRKFVSVDAVSGFQNRIKLMEKHLKLPYFESNLPTLAKFSSTPSAFSGYGFSPRGSNIGSDDILTGLKALGVPDPWRKLTALTHDIGLARTNLEDDYRALASSRHTSAHNPTGNIPTQDLLTNIDVASLIAVTIAATLQTLKPIYLSSTTATQLASRTNAPDVKFRFIDRLTDGYWMERKVGAGRGVKKYPTLETAKSGVAARVGTFSVLVRAEDLKPLELS